MKTKQLTKIVEQVKHFGGHGPHRYDDNDKICGYCGRPKNWKPVNASVIAGELSGEII